MHDEGLQLKTSVICSIISTVYHIFYISYSRLTPASRHKVMSLYSDEGLQLKMPVIRSTISTV